MTFDDFLSSVLPSARGCPDEVALDHIVKAARAFCAGTLVWNYSTAPIVAAATVGKYTLQIGDEEELVRLIRLTFGGSEYPVASGAYGRAAAREQWGSSGVVTFGNDFTLTPIPSVDGTLIFTDVAVKPKLGAAYWPDDLGEFVPDIASGAISTLCALPRCEWTDQATAVAQGAAFRQRIAVVGIKVSKGFGASSRSARICWK